MKSLSDPTKLKPIDKKDGLIHVIIETPAGSRNKFAFDPDQEIFALKKVLPAGMVFPYDFGFLPRTQAPDGDPIDVLLLMDEPAFPGCAVKRSAREMVERGPGLLRQLPQSGGQEVQAVGLQRRGNRYATDQRSSKGCVATGDPRFIRFVIGGNAVNL